MNKNFSYKIVYINYILAILIVFLHSNNVHMFKNEMIGSEFLIFIENTISTLARIAVPLFFLISAYLFYKKFNMSLLMYKYKSRFKSLVIPYIVWSTVSFIYIAMLTHISFFSSRMNMETVQLTLSNILNCILLSKYAPLWFIRDLIIFVLVAPLIFFIIKRKLLCIITIALFTSINFIINTDYYSVMYWIPLYLSGAYLGHYYTDTIESIQFINKKHSVIKIISAITFIMVFIIAYFNENDGASMYFYRLTSPFLIWILIDGISFNKKPEWWMEISFFIYCTHFVIISSLQKIVLLVLGKSTLAFFITYLITPIIVVLMITVVAYIMKKYMNPIWRFTTGGR